MTFDKQTSPPALAEEEIADDEIDDGFENDPSDTDASPEAGEQPDAHHEPDAEEGVLYEEQVQPEYGILGLTLRELLIVVSWAVVFTASFFPLTSAATGTVWTTGISWILTIGVPTAAAFLVVLRRFSPQGIRRVGSLGIDQFASVAALVATVSWAQLLWMQIVASTQTGAVLVGWPVVLATVGALGLVATTVAAPLIPRLREDFQGRLETLAHRNANPVRPVIPRPRTQPEPAGENRPTRSADAPDAPASPVANAEAPEVTDPDATRVVPRIDPALLADSVPGASDADSHDEPRTETELTVVLTEGRRESSAEPASETLAPEAPASGASDDGSADQASDVEADAALTPTHDDSEPIEVYNTGAVDALQEIFEAGGAERPIAVPSTDTGTIQEAGTGIRLRRDRAESGRAESATADAESEGSGDDGGGDDATDQGRAADAPSEAEPIDDELIETVPRRSDGYSYSAPAQDPFWILAKTERDVFDERGLPLFRIGPSSWTLVIEDRGGAFVVRHDDGRIGYLHDISDITKG